MRLLHNNAIPIQIRKRSSGLKNQDGTLWEHPPRSPDAPSDFHLFGPLKHRLGGMRFETDAEVMNKVETFYRKRSVVGITTERHFQTCAAMGQMYEGGPIST